uniref:Uncharacterized protein n=1 Tax=Arundo donax TaxID=35708 RepID=A0A0A9E3D4_ARUDO
MHGKFQNCHMYSVRLKTIDQNLESRYKMMELFSAKFKWRFTKNTKPSMDNQHTRIILYGSIEQRLKRNCI